MAGFDTMEENLSDNKNNVTLEIIASMSMSSPYLIGMISLYVFTLRKTYLN